MTAYTRQRYVRWGGVCALGGLIGVMAFACTPVSTGDNEQTAAWMPSLPQGDDQFVENEPNNDYQQIRQLSLYDHPQGIELSGTIAGSLDTPDVDLFGLGVGRVGDRITVTVDADNDSDLAVGLLDEQFRLLGYLRYPTITAEDDAIDLILRQDNDQLFLAVISRTTASYDRDYTLSLRLDPNQYVGEPQPQIVILEFLGAKNVQIGERGSVDIAPFDSGTIAPLFAKRTDEMIAAIYDKMLADYQGLQVELFLSDDPDLPAGPATTIYFGYSDDRLLGLADNIDGYNRDPSQAAIVYTDAFALFNIFNPDLEDMAQVLANVASHELGHLLGLRHTADGQDLMDVTASARAMMLDQWFKVSPLYVAILPTGLQDSPTLLSWSVGGSLLPASTALVSRQGRTVPPGHPDDDFYIPRDQLAGSF